MHESESEVTQSCPTLSDPLDCSLPGSSVHGSFQARVLEWGSTRILNPPSILLFLQYQSPILDQYLPLHWTRVIGIS